MEKSMESIDAGTIARMVKLCVGHTDAIGETNYDESSRENLKILFNVLDLLLDDVQSMVPKAKDEAFSASLIGCMSISYLAALRDKAHDWLEQRW